MLNERLCPSEFVSRMIVALALHDSRFPFSDFMLFVSDFLPSFQSSRKRSPSMLKWYIIIFGDFITLNVPLQTVSIGTREDEYFT